MVLLKEEESGQLMSRCMSPKLRKTHEMCVALAPSGLYCLGSRRPHAVLLKFLSRGAGCSDSEYGSYCNRVNAKCTVATISMSKAESSSPFQ